MLKNHAKVIVPTPRTNVIKPAPRFSEELMMILY